MLTIRRAAERGHFDHGWLDTRHTFSFADYRDPAHMGFRVLRVVNEDVVQGGEGFPSHPHRDMEIVTCVLSGALQHRDSMGNGSVLRPGEVQRMSAGTGVVHSEFNASQSEPVHLLQIWLLPAKKGLEPTWEQKAFPEGERRGRLRPVVTPDARAGSLLVHQDVTLYAGLFDGAESARLALAPGRHAWVQVARGRVRVNDRLLEAGDGLAVSDEKELVLERGEKAEVLVFDLP